MNNKNLWDPFAEFEKIVLPNGLTIYAAHWPGRAWQKTGFVVHSGAQQDKIGFEGTAHFVEHLVSLNSFMKRDDIWKYFSSFGGSAELGSTYYIATQYNFLLPAEKKILEKGLDIFGDMLLFANMTKSIETERIVIDREYHKKFPIKAIADIERKKHATLFSGHWLERFLRPLGAPDSIAKIAEKDLQEFYDKHYVPANISIVTMGGLDTNSIVDLISKSPFGQKKDGVRNPLLQPIETFPGMQNNREVFNLSKILNDAKSTDINGFELSVRLPCGTNERPVIFLQDMLRDVLFKELREQRSWVYSLGCGYEDFSQFRVFEINCSKMEQSVYSQLEAVISDCIDSIRHKETMFNDLKKSKLASLALTDFNRSGVFDPAMSEIRMDHTITSFECYKQELKETTFNDVIKLLDFFTKENSYSAMLLP